jgi:hypothetical protein
LDQLERESSAARLEEAVNAFRAALQESTRERVPLDWATTQTNLGNALQRLGEHESGTARLEQAVDAFRAALQERDPQPSPLLGSVRPRRIHRAGCRTCARKRVETPAVVQQIGDLPYPNIAE